MINYGEFVDFDGIEFEGPLHLARRAVEESAKARELIEATGDEMAALEDFFGWAIGAMYGPDDCFLRGGEQEHFGHMLYHIAGFVPEQRRRNIRVAFDGDRLHSLIEVDDDRVFCWQSLEDWRRRWGADSHHIIPDISTFQQPIAQSSA